LKHGVTRDTVETGNDVTHNMRTIKSVPMQLTGDNPPKLFEARGEVYMTRDELGRINKAESAAGRKGYANPRNLTSGTIQMLDPKICAQRKLNLFAYALGATDGVTVKTHQEALALLKKLGFAVNPHTMVCKH